MTPIVIILIFVAHALDTHSTITVLNLGGREVNPFMRFVINRGGYPAFIAVKVALAAFIAYAAIETLAYIEWFGWAMLIGHTVLYTLIVRNNFGVAKRMER